MGEFKAGTWLVILLVYFGMFYIITVAGLSVADEYNLQTNLTASYGGFGVDENILNNGGICINPTSIRNFPTIDNNWLCASLGIEYNEDCDALVGCELINTTDCVFLGFGCGEPYTYCGGEINTTYYNITDPNDRKSTFCNAEGLQDKDTCGYFGCVWIDEKNITTETEKAISDSLTQDDFWNTVKFMAGFEIEFNTGLATQINFMISFLLFWIPLFMLVWAIYMAIPFLH